MELFCLVPDHFAFIEVRQLIRNSMGAESIPTSSKILFKLQFANTHFSHTWDVIVASQCMITSKCTQTISFHQRHAHYLGYSPNGKRTHVLHKHHFTQIPRFFLVIFLVRIRTFPFPGITRVHRWVGKKRVPLAATQLSSHKIFLILAVLRPSV